MNNQSIRGIWKLLEDFPTRNGQYLVAFRGSDGEFSILDTEVWDFSGSWAPYLSESYNDYTGEYPVYYLDLVMPKFDQ